VIGGAPGTAAHLKERLGPRGADVVAHGRVDGLQREPFVDAIVLDGVDLVDGTAAVRRATAAPLLIIGPDQAVAATCLGMGADAWLPSGSAMNLVAAQVLAMLAKRALSPPRTHLKVGRIELNLEARRAHVQDRELPLTPREFDLLNVFLLNEGTVLSRDRILAAAWGPRFVGEPKTVDVHVAWLRPKLEASGVRITTLRGIGYRLDELERARPRVLFVCVENAGRSQIAAAFLKRMSDGRVDVESAGTKPAKRVHSEVMDVMREVGIDVSNERPKALSAEMARAATHVVTMGCEAEECPVFASPVEDWGIRNPAGLPAPAVREIRDEIERRVRLLLSELNP